MNKGFTLIETLVYLGLFGIIMVGVISVAYTTFESNGRQQTKALLQEEGDFLLAKLNWTLTGATSTSVNLPILGNIGSTLDVTKSTGSNPMCLTLVSGKMQTKRGSSCAISAGYVDLNNSNVTVSSLIFGHRGSAAGTEWVDATITLTSLTPNGQTINATSTTTKYLRK